MTTDKNRLINNLKVAASFLRSIDTGRAKLDFELSELANRVEKIASEQDATRRRSSAEHKNATAA